MRYPIVVPVVAVGILASAGFSSVAAQDYPTRPIRTITTTSAGGLSDIFARAMGEELHKRWGQPLIVDNRPGGSQNVGVRACADAAPDGYTICILNTDPVVYNQFLFKNVPPVDPLICTGPLPQLFTEPWRRVDGSVSVATL